jgi:osmoprotectant transport system ATP-binding protein
MVYNQDWGDFLLMIKFQNVSKKYNQKVVAVNNINLKINRGEFVVLIGPSGCGKTTTLEMINRLEKPTSGSIYINGQDISKVDEVALRRNIGYVIQQTGLMPHLTIGENIGLVPRLQKWPENRIKDRVIELLEMVGMEPGSYLTRYPHELSGGQQQRIGVLRGIAAEPDIILMDEPFGALDPITRENLQDELKKLQDQLRKTIVFVTHDMDEALKLGDRVVLMRQGQIVQADDPEDLLRNPADEFVEEFIGRDRLALQVETLTVEEVARTTPITASPELGLLQAARRMRQKRVDSLVVVDEEDRLIGIVTAKSVNKHKSNSKRIKDIVQVDIPTVSRGTSAKTAFELLFLSDVGLLPIIGESDRLYGIVTRSSLAEMLYQVVWDSDFPSSNGLSHTKMQASYN